MTIIDQLVAHLSRLPGLGRKSATRLVYYLLRTDAPYVRSLATLVGELRERVHPCPECGNYSELERCSVCSDPRRDRGHLCVVEEAKDVATIEATGEFHGLYHVLGGAISPIDGVGPKELRIESLLERVRAGECREVILATNPTVEGETTAHYLAKLLKGRGLRVTRLAFGLPMGGDLEYADRLTLTRALKGRSELE